jgi:hypothetical protein
LNQEHISHQELESGSGRRNFAMENFLEEIQVAWKKKLDLKKT